MDAAFVADATQRQPTIPARPRTPPRGTDAGAENLAARLRRLLCATLEWDLNVSALRPWCLLASICPLHQMS